MDKNRFNILIDGYTMMSSLKLINNFYIKYKSIIHFNKNILIAAIVTAILDVVIVVYMLPQFIQITAFWFHLYH